MFVLSKLRSSLIHSLQAMMVRFKDFSRTAQVFITLHALGCGTFSGGCFLIQWVSLLFVFWAFCNEHIRCFPGISSVSLRFSMQ